jgi:hypothetical protein
MSSSTDTMKKRAFAKYLEVFKDDPDHCADIEKNYAKVSRKLLEAAVETNSKIIKATRPVKATAETKSLTSSSLSETISSSLVKNILSIIPVDKLVMLVLTDLPKAADSFGLDWAKIVSEWPSIKDTIILNALNLFESDEAENEVIEEWLNRLLSETDENGMLKVGRVLIENNAEVSKWCKFELEKVKKK